jgi:hypothetical protein
MNKTDETLKLAKECGATTYTNRHYPDAAAVTFSPLAWEKFCEQACSAPPVQEAVATVKAKRDGGGTFVHWTQLPVAGMKLYTAAQPAVPDAITDNSENPDYRAGWNECRETMLEMMKARTL